MPYTEDQKKAAAVALYSPEKLYKRNRAMLSMSREQLDEMVKAPTKKKKKTALGRE